MEGMEKVVHEFLAESFENLDQLDQDMVKLEKDPDDREVFARIFRTIHTIKGTCGFLAFHTLESVTHLGESVLSLLRSGKLELDGAITSVLLQMFDAVRNILREIESTGQEGDRDYAEVINALEEVQARASGAGGSDRVKKKAEVTRERAGNSRASQDGAQDGRLPAGNDQTGEPGPTAAAGNGAATRSDPSQDTVPKGGLRSSRKGGATKGGSSAKGGGERTSGGARGGHGAAAGPVSAFSEVLGGARPAKRGSELDASAEPAESDLPLASSVAETSIRVDVGVLDHLMNLVGELVLARNQIIQSVVSSASAVDDGLSSASQRLNTVTGELQEVVMKTRMQPISSIWNKIPRFVRDLALSFGKEVEIEMEGQETELDKSIIEAIKGSILHLVRNAVDHGIESPELRAQRGKAGTGRLSLRADHEGGHIMIEVSDDGGGLDHDRILARAVEAGLVTPERAVTLHQREIESFIFRPGFSTARKVTSVSGRGVGLDVVRTNVESVGGSVELQTDRGVSTTFRVKIPLTLAIIPVLIVHSAGRRYAIPQSSVLELVRLDGEGQDLGIEKMHGVPVYRLRGQLLPLAFLNRELGFEGSLATLADARLSIVVLQADDRKFGLVVDAIADSQEIVVKPLGRLLIGLPYAGATILGDGRVALILDVVRLGIAAGLVAEHREHAFQELSTAEAQPGDTATARTRLLCLAGPDDERMAIDFNLVARLEILPLSKVERVGEQEMIQYRGEILQLIRLGSVLPERRSERRGPASSDLVAEDTMQVVVCAIDGRRAGIVVHRILDIIDQKIDVTRPRSRVGVAACIVLRDRVTELIDVPEVVRMADPEFFERAIQETLVVSS